jgi:hypothetical protein
VHGRDLIFPVATMVATLPSWSPPCLQGDKAIAPDTPSIMTFNTLMPN